MKIKVWVLVELIIIVTCYHNLSYSLNWSTVDRGTSRRPTANLMETSLRPLRSLWMMIVERCRAAAVMILYQNKRHCFKERRQYYLRMSYLFFYGWHTYNYKRLKLFCNLHVQCIHLTHGLYTMYHTHVPCETSADQEGGPGFRTPLLRFVKGEVLCRGLIGIRGGPTVVFIFFFIYFTNILHVYIHVLPSSTVILFLYYIVSVFLRQPLVEHCHVIRNCQTIFTWNERFH